MLLVAVPFLGLVIMVMVAVSRFALELPEKSLASEGNTTTVFIKVEAISVLATGEFGKAGSNTVIERFSILH